MRRYFCVSHLPFPLHTHKYIRCACTPCFPEMHRKYRKSKYTHQKLPKGSLISGYQASTNGTFTINWRSLLCLINITTQEPRLKDICQFFTHFYNEMKSSRVRIPDLSSFSLFRLCLLGKPAMPDYYCN